MVGKKTISPKKKSKKELDFIKNYNKFISNFKGHRFFTFIKKNNFDKLKKNFLTLLDNEYINYSKCKALIDLFINKKYYQKYINHITSEMYKNIKDNNDDDNDNDNYDIATDIVIDFCIEIFDIIYKKFNKFCEKCVITLLKGSHNKIFFDHLIEKKFKINNSYNEILKTLQYNYFDLIENITYENIASSTYIKNNINSIKNILDELFEKPDYNKLINLIIDNEINFICNYCSCVYYNFNIDNLNSFIFKNIKLDTIYKIKLLLLNFLINIYNKYIDISARVRNDLHNNGEINYENLLNLYTKTDSGYESLKKMCKKMFKNKEIELDYLSKININMMEYLIKNLRSYSKLAKKNKTEYDCIYLWWHNYDINYYTDNCMNVFRNQFIKLFYEYIKSEKDINNIIKNTLFDYRDTFLTLDEKVKLFKLSYDGKVKSSDLEQFIINSNELSSFLIKNSPIQENYIKYSLITGNYKLLEIIADMKYTFKIDHFKYIISSKNIKNVLRIINKYKPINFLDNLEWYKYIENIIDYKDVCEIIYDDNNIELQNELKEKLENYIKSKLCIDKLNDMDFNTFCSYMIKNNIYLELNDILNITDNDKKLFVFRLNYNK